MLRRSACFARYRAPSPNRPAQPQHAGSPLQVGETCLMRRPDAWHDLLVQLRGIDGPDAVVLIIDHLEIVPLRCLRRR